MSFTIDPQPTYTDLYQGPVKVATARDSGILSLTQSPAGRDATLLAGGDNVAYTNIPDGVSEVDFNFIDAVHNSASALVFYIGTASGLVTSGYNGSSVCNYNNGVSQVSQQTTDAAMPIIRTANNQIVSGTIRLRLVDRTVNAWAIEATGLMISAGQLTNWMSATRGIYLPSKLTQVKLTGSSAGTFSSGRCNITYR